MSVASRGSTSSTSTSPAPVSRQPEKQVTVLKPRDESTRLSSATSLPSIPVSTLQGETPPQQPMFLQRTGEGRMYLAYFIPPQQTKSLRGYIVYRNHHVCCPKYLVSATLP